MYEDNGIRYENILGNYLALAMLDITRKKETGTMFMAPHDVH